MQSRTKTMRQLGVRPVASAIPRKESAVYLLLNRLAREQERLAREEADLMMQLQVKQKRLAEIKAEMEGYMGRTQSYKPVARSEVVAPPSITLDY